MSSEQQNGQTSRKAQAAAAIAAIDMELELGASAADAAAAKKRKADSRPSNGKQPEITITEVFKGVPMKK